MVCLSAPISSKSASSFKTLRNAAKVLPVPVGETIRAFSPRSIIGHAAIWAGVGASNLDSNHFVTEETFSGSGIRKQYKSTVGRGNRLVNPPFISHIEIWIK